MSLTNLYAFCLPILLFFYWWILGYAVLSLTRTQRHLLQNMLLAPTVGLITSLLTIFLLNHAGLPIHSFATPMTFALLGTSLGIFFWKKPTIPLRPYLPFMGIIFLALWLTGRPLLSFGFDWVSYSNDDMVNYSLGAVRFLWHGYSDLLNIKDLLANKDYSQYFWFMHFLDNHRAGSELILAWVSGVTHLNAMQVFMPVILALHLTLVSVAGALIYQSKRLRLAALALCLLLSFSALNSLGTLYQLIAQVGGISIFIASIVFLLQPFSHHKKYGNLQQGFLIGLTISALMIYYPEVSPFLAIAFVLYLALNLIKGTRPSVNFYYAIASSILTCVVLLNTFLIGTIIFIFGQAGRGTEIHSSILFPYYLLPIGLANLWGVQAIGKYGVEPWTSLSIALGALLSITTLIILFNILRKQVSHLAIVLLVMIAVGIILFIKNSDFGLFKLAMFIQPFLLGALTLYVFQTSKSSLQQWFFVLGLIILNVWTQNYYVERSRALTPGGLSEMIYASNSKINHEYRKLVTNLPTNSKIISDDFNICLLKFEAFNSRGKEFYFDTFDSLFPRPTWQVNGKSSFFKLTHAEVDLPDNLVNSINHIRQQYPTRSFNLLDPKDPQHITSFKDMMMNLTKADLQSDNTYLIADTAMRSVLNRQQTFVTDRNFVLLPINKVHNHLLFVSSSLGPIYYDLSESGRQLASFFNLEGDWFYPGKTFQAIRRYLLFRVVNPTPTVRVMLAITASLKSDHENKIPQPFVIGSTRVPFDSIGHGSARLFSEPLKPQIIAGNPYIVIDMNDEGKKFPAVKKGLMQLYGKTIPYDHRNIVTFARNISLISEDEYRAMKAPSWLGHFPADLANSNLEYSGIYEDGWIAEDSFFKLTQPHNARNLVVQGDIPPLSDPNFTTDITVNLDGKTLITQHLKVGKFIIKLPVPYRTGNQKLALHFSNVRNLPKGDERPAAVHIDALGFSY